MVSDKFKSTWDSSHPQVYDSWESDGRSWVIQDLAPEDDERALDILVQHLVPDEAICVASGLAEDSVSLGEFKEIWTKMLSERMSLGVYTTVEGQKTLVALNACYVSYANDGDMSPRNWDSTCPRVYDKWESKGRSFVIQDLDPADFEKALDLMLEHFLPDETLNIASNLANDPVSISSVRGLWKEMLEDRMSLGCYLEESGNRTLVALNLCHVLTEDEMEVPQAPGESWKNVSAAINYVSKARNGMKHMGLDRALHAAGLMVHREYRGERLGARLLNAREPLCLSQGIKGTETLFTGPASQKLAERCGFETITVVSFDELADAGLNYPRNGAVLKNMVKKYA